MPQTDWFSENLDSKDDETLIELRSSDYSENNMKDLFNGSLKEGDIVMIAGHLLQGNMQVNVQAEVDDDESKVVFEKSIKSLNDPSSEQNIEMFKKLDQTKLRVLSDQVIRNAQDRNLIDIK